jgi:hypothetical protein
MMTSPEEYRRRAQHFLKLARTCKDSQIAARLRVIAADYFECAGQVGDKAAQRQPPVHPDKKASR